MKTLSLNLIFAFPLVLTGCLAANTAPLCTTGNLKNVPALEGKLQMAFIDTASGKINEKDVLYYDSTRIGLGTVHLKEVAKPGEPELTEPSAIDGDYHLCQIKKTLVLEPVKPMSLEHYDKLVYAPMILTSLSDGGYGAMATTYDFDKLYKAGINYKPVTNSAVDLDLGTTIVAENAGLSDPEKVGKFLKVVEEQKGPIAVIRRR